MVGCCQRNRNRKAAGWAKGAEAPAYKSMTRSGLLEVGQEMVIEGDEVAAGGVEGCVAGIDDRAAVDRCLRQFAPLAETVEE